MRKRKRKCKLLSAPGSPPLVIIYLIGPVASFSILPQCQAKGEEEAAAMTSRRAQVRTLLSSSLQQGSGGEVVGDRDAVVSRTESYLAAVDVWATRGNQKAVSRVGPGLVAVCAWLAIKRWVMSAQ